MNSALSSVMHRFGSPGFLIYKPQYLSQIPKDRLNIDEASTKMLVTSHEIINDFDTILGEIYGGESRDNYFDVINSYGSQLRGFDMGWAIATTGNLAINIEKAKHILFDENFQGWGMEDTEFAYQLHKLGYGFKFNYDAINFHQQHERPKSNIDDLKKNMKYFIKKHNTIEAYLFLMMFAIEDYSFGIVNSNNLLKLYNYTESKEIEIIVKYMVDTYLNI